MATIPIYMITGFLEAGKTSFLADVLEGGDFADGQKGLLVLCEEGEVEYNEQHLLNMNIDMVTCGDEEQFNAAYLKSLEKQYRPKRMFIEMNGMWDCRWMYGDELPLSMEIAQVITIVDGSTFSVYLTNMRSLLSQLFQYTEMTIFNRCTTDMDLLSYRRTVRGLSPRAMVYFEDAEGNPIDPGKDQPPYDINAPVIQVDDIDYGLWYLDVYENRDRYEGKKVRFRAKIMKTRRLGSEVFIPGRNVMTCCVQDIRFVGYLCKADFAKILKSRQWVWLTSDIRYEYQKEYGEEGPVLYGTDYEIADPPEEDTVYFN